MTALARRAGSSGSWLTQRAANQDLARRGLEARNESQLAALKIDGITKVGEYSMERLAELNQDRLALCGDDQVMNAIHAETMMIAVFGVHRVQRRLGYRLGEI